MDAENKVEREELKKESKVVRFFVTLIWLAISIGVDLYAIFSEGYLIGAIAEFVFFGITFLVPYLRKKDSFTRWIGWLALLQGAWLIYMMISAGA